MLRDFPCQGGGCCRAPRPSSSYLCDQGLVLRHELIQILLVLVDTPQEVGSLVLQLAQLLVRLRERSRASSRGGGLTSKHAPLGGPQHPLPGSPNPVELQGEMRGRCVLLALLSTH